MNKASTGSVAYLAEASDGVSVVIPCLNEAESIAAVVQAARDALDSLGVPFEIIVVDNGSTDGSAAKARTAGATVIKEQRIGYGSAIRCGFAAAKHSILLMADGDLTYDLTKLADIVQPILAGEADFVLGNRLDGVQPKAMPFLHQHIGNPFLTKLVQIMFHRRDIKDAHCGLRAIRQDAYQQLGCITTGMEFASEMIIRAIYGKLRISQKDIKYHPRVGKSKLRTFRDGWRHLRFLLLHSPSMVFVFPGLIFWAVSLLAIIPLAIGPVMVATRSIDIHFMLVIGVLNIISMQFMSIGILAKAYAHLSGIRHDPVAAWLYECVSFETGAVVSGLLIALGAVVGIHVVGHWGAKGFGALDMSRPLFFGALCIINGVQLGACSYLFSMMALPRRMDRVDPASKGRALQDQP